MHSTTVMTLAAATCELKLQCSSVFYNYGAAEDLYEVHSKPLSLKTNKQKLSNRQQDGSGDRTTCYTSWETCVPSPELTEKERRKLAP